MFIELKKDLAYSDLFISATAEELKALQREIDAAIKSKDENTKGRIFSEKPEWNYYVYINKKTDI